MQGNSDRVNLCTTAQFDGMTAIIDPKESWVARWKRTGMPGGLISIVLVLIVLLDSLVRGIYAVKLSAKMSEALRRELDEQGIRVSAVHALESGRWLIRPYSRALKWSQRHNSFKGCLYLYQIAINRHSLTQEVFFVAKSMLELLEYSPLVAN